MLRNAAQKDGGIPGNAELGGDCLDLLVQLDERLLPKAVILDRLEYSVETGSNWRKVNIAFEKYLVGVLYSSHSRFCFPIMYTPCASNSFTKQARIGYWACLNAHFFMVNLKKSKHMRTNNTIADTQLNDIIDNYRGETRDWWKLVNEDVPKRSSSFFVHCP